MLTTLSFRDNKFAQIPVCRVLQHSWQAMPYNGGLTTYLQTYKANQSCNTLNKTSTNCHKASLPINPHLDAMIDLQNNKVTKVHMAVSHVEKLGSCRSKQSSSDNLHAFVSQVDHLSWFPVPTTWVRL